MAREGKKGAGKVISGKSTSGCWLLFKGRKVHSVRGRSDGSISEGNERLQIHAHGLGP